MNRKDRKLGMGQPIKRREFLHDVALSAAALGLPMNTLGQMSASGAASNTPYYPPTLTGLRGSHPGSWEAAHALAREGQTVPGARDTAERYDLVVVGAGISGLAAAWFYRQRIGPDARILLLENHDDFGGHARRNEFHQGGGMNLAWGGAINMEYESYSDRVNSLMEALGIDFERLQDAKEYSWTDDLEDMTHATWFGAEQYGRDVLVKGVQMDLEGPAALAAGVDQFPISQTARQALKRFLVDDSSLVPDMDWGQFERWVHSTPYPEFLRMGGVPDEAIALFSDTTLPIWGLIADNLSVAECMYNVLPGLHRLGKFRAYFEGDTFEDTKSAVFPDGNASITRLLVRDLIQEATPDFPAGSDPHAIVKARLDYAALDVDRSPTRLRLNSTVLNVQENPGGSVVVSYANQGQLLAVQARQVVMACYNRIIPHLVPSLPEPQKAALSKCVKRPMLVVNVLLRNGQPLKRSGIMAAYLPGRLLQNFRLVWGANAGGFRQDFSTEKPVVLQFFCGFRVPVEQGQTMAQQHQAARAHMLGLAFEDYEREVRTSLNGVYGQAGFDAAQDILAITVNRWPHGYARDHTDLEDEDWNSEPPPNVLGRRRFGNIAIANSDAGADAYLHTAIDQAWRAIKELSS